jgi:hypothetical protein
MVNGLTQWFMQDPLKNLLLIVGSGGIVAAAIKWTSMWMDRRRIHVRVLSEHFDLRTARSLKYVALFL